MFQFASKWQARVRPISGATVCVCVHRYNRGLLINRANRAVKFQDSGGVWHFHPTTRNEAVDESGMGKLTSVLYLQIVELNQLLLDFVSLIVLGKLPGF